MNELISIKNRLKKFDECLSILKGIRDNISLREYVTEPFYYSTGERNLQLAIEILLDIGNFIISRAGFRQPESYSDILQILKEQGILSSNLLQKIEKLPAFRNLLVHEYLIIDREIVYKKILTQLPDLENLMLTFVDYLKL